jgi:hypothetical protein
MDRTRTRRLLERLVAAAKRTGADAATVCRQLPILNSCLSTDDEPVLLARATRPGDRASYLVLLTARRLVVTRETRVLRRQQLHLNADARHLSDVIWTPEPTMGAIALSATAIDGVREHFWIRTAAVESSAAALQQVFGSELALV